MVSLDDLIGVQKPVVKDTGLRRKVWLGGRDQNLKCDEDGVSSCREVEEKLVEVLLKEEEYCHRCSYCGVLELAYEGEIRFRKVGSDRNGRPKYWCGGSVSLPLPLSSSDFGHEVLDEDRDEERYEEMY